MDLLGGYSSGGEADSPASSPGMQSYATTPAAELTAAGSRADCYLQVHRDKIWGPCHSQQAVPAKKQKPLPQLGHMPSSLGHGLLGFLRSHSTSGP